MTRRIRCIRFMRGNYDPVPAPETTVDRFPRGRDWPVPADRDNGWASWIKKPRRTGEVLRGSGGVCTLKRPRPGEERYARFRRNPAAAEPIRPVPNRMRVLGSGVAFSVRSPSKSRPSATRPVCSTTKVSVFATGVQQEVDSDGSCMRQSRHVSPQRPSPPITPAGMIGVRLLFR